ASSASRAAKSTNRSDFGLRAAGARPTGSRIRFRRRHALAWASSLTPRDDEMNEVVSGRATRPMSRRRAFLWRAISVLLALLILLVLALMWWWDHEPERFDVVKTAEQHAAQHHHRVVPGSVTTATLIEVSRVLLEKRGGYLANDVLPPGVIMDNVPNWEKGVVLQIRDLALSMRNDFARSQSQSVED